MKRISLKRITLNQWRYICAVACLGALNMPAVAGATETVGWIESVTIFPAARVLDAKLDTGADTSSVDARGITVLQKNGEDWVQFKIGPDASVEQHKVERWVKIRGAGGREQRPVVRLSLCIGSKIYDEEFTLRDRSNMNYPVLLGRSTLAHLPPIDVKKQYTLQAHCPG